MAYKKRLGTELLEQNISREDIPTKTIALEEAKEHLVKAHNRLLESEKAIKEELEELHRALMRAEGAELDALGAK